MLSAYWSGNSNYGDLLTSEYIFRGDFDVQFRDVEFAKVVAVGSVLNRFVAMRRKRRYPLYVFGTGIDENQLVDGAFFRPMKIYALRGVRTLNYYRSLSHDDNDYILGDSGLLVHRSLLKKRGPVKYRLGIIPHGMDLGSPVFENIKKMNEKSIIISPLTPPDIFLEKIMECECVISTALHPIIACDALRIPNLWADVIGRPVDMKFKFWDYYSAFGIAPTPFPLYDKDVYEDMYSTVLDQYKISDGQIKDKTDELEYAYKKMIEDLHSDAVKDACENIYYNAAKQMARIKRVGNRIINRQ